MKIMDAIWVSFIILAIAMTVLSFRRPEHHVADMQSVTIQEIVPRPPANKI